MVDESCEVTRWRRYGKDRLYVARADGTKLGWWDLQSDDPHPERPEDAEQLGMVVRRWQALEPSTDVDITPVTVLDGTQEQAAAQPWLDLAQNAPGAEARARAVEAKEAAPVRTLLARVLQVHTDERAWRLGAAGEERVASQFDKVAKRDPRWQFIHAIPVGTRGSDIDHLIIGPGGVFTANAKNHPNGKVWVGGDTVMVNGQRQPYVRNSRHEASRASKLLSQACGFHVHVEGLIVLVNAIEWKVKTPPVDVHVVARREVARWLLRHGEVLDQAARAVIFDAARRSTTWR